MPDGFTDDYSVWMNRAEIKGLNLEINNIFCIGRNYKAHAEELNQSVPTEPIVFMKPTSAVCYSGQKIKLPKISQQVHYEVEILVAIGKKGIFFA